MNTGGREEGRGGGMEGGGGEERDKWRRRGDVGKG